ncbi:MAG: hypothetical protein IKW40_00460, partial [Anaerotignum sp.]|nr:hypothetical protein [Anaerotignum sp.]
QTKLSPTSNGNQDLNKDLYQTLRSVSFKIENEWKPGKMERLFSSLSINPIMTKKGGLQRGKQSIPPGKNQKHWYHGAHRRW